MSNEIENIIDLFDELYVLETQDDVSVKVENSQVLTTTLVDDAIEIKVDAEVPIVETLVEPLLPTQENQTLTKNQPELTTPQQEPIAEIPLNYSGANKRHIAIIYNDKVNDSRENVEMLSNLITKALKFSMDDVAVVRVSKNQNHTIQQIIGQLEAKHAIIWGAPSDFNFNNIHEINLVNNTQLMVGDFVQNYHDNNDYKAQLWLAIQNLLAK